MFHVYRVQVVEVIEGMWMLERRVMTSDRHLLRTLIHIHLIYAPSHTSIDRQLF